MRTSLKVGLVAAFALVVGLTTSAQAALNLPTMQCSYSFSSSMGLGARGASVMDLQKVLNMYPETRIATTGAGSPGMETSYFGPATRAAVIKFQAINQVSPTSGFVGALTRAVLNQVCSGTSASLPVGCTSTSGFSPVTGVACNTGVSTTFPAGCTSATGFSSITGLACNGGVISQTGPIVATIAATNPASGVIVAGQATADLLHFTLSGNGTVNSITLKRSGISDQNTLTNVYLYDGAARLTDGYSFNSTGDIVINNLGLMVNGSKTISVRADVYSLAPSGQTLAIWLTSLTSGATVSNVNLSGNTFAIASGSTLSSIQLSGSNTVAAATVNAGTSAYTVWRQVVQVNTRPLWLKAANFRVTGSAPVNALTNVKMYVDGVDTGKVASMTAMNGSNYLSFDLTNVPLTLNTGSHTLELRSDIVAGSSYNFTVSLQQASDLMVFDPQVGVNVAISSFTQSASGLITIGGGSVTQTVDPTFNTATNITGGASNATIAKFKLRGYGEDVKVYSMTVTPVLTGTTPAQAGSCIAGAACGLQNVSLYYNGSQVGSQVSSWLQSGAITFTLGSQLIIPAGVESTLEVRADLRNAAGTNYTAGTVSANTSIAQANVEGMTSHTNTNFPSTLTGTGNSLTIQTGMLVVSKNPGYTSQSVNPNTAGVKIGSFTLQNQSSSESVRVTSLKVDLGGSSALTNLAALRTSENANPVQPQLTNTFSVDFTLAPGATKTVEVFADSGSTASVNVIVSLTVASIGVSSNVSSAGTLAVGQTITIGTGTFVAPTLLTSNSTQAQYIAVGTTVGVNNGSRSSFNFGSTGGSAVINELKFTVTSGTASQTPASSITVNGVTGVLNFVSSTVSEAYLTGLNIAVPNGAGGVNVDATVNYGPAGSTGTVSGTTAAVTLTYAKYTSGNVTATSCASGCTNTILVPVAAPTITVVASKPVVTVNPSQQTGLILGAENKIGEVTIAADAQGNIAVNQLIFTVGGSGLSAAVDINDTTPILRDNGTAVSGVVCAAGAATGPITCTFTPGYTITGATSKTFSLHATVNNSASAGSTASISTALTTAGFLWTDIAGNGTASAGTGALIYNFPTNSYSIRQ